MNSVVRNEPFCAVGVAQGGAIGAKRSSFTADSVSLLDVLSDTLHAPDGVPGQIAEYLSSCLQPWNSDEANAICVTHCNQCVCPCIVAPRFVHKADCRHEGR